MSTIKELVKEAYEIAHDHNKNGHHMCYTYQEAIVYDPLVRSLHEVIKKLEEEDN